MPESSDRGALTEAVYYILLSLYRPMHGYGIMQNIKELSRGRVFLGAGTLYGAINTLLERGWIVSLINQAASQIGSRRKEYIITEAGKAVIHEELARLEELISNGRIVTGGSGHENKRN